MKRTTTHTRLLKLLLYWVARSLGLFALCRVLSRDRIRILCYHGGSIGDECDFNPTLFMSKDVFVRRMRWTESRGFSFISIDKLTDLLSHSTRPPKLPLVITFDDGWLSTISELIPALRSRSIPSCLYLSTKYFGESWPIVPVVVRYLLWKTTFSECSFPNIPGLQSSVDVIKSREELAQAISSWVEARAVDRASVCTDLESVAEALGISKEALALASGRFDYIRGEHVKVLEKSNCSIQSHGHEHRFFDDDLTAFALDLQTCSGIIQSLNLRAPLHHCYPSGVYRSSAETTLREAGLITATTCDPGLIQPGSGESRFYLPRILDSNNLSQVEFEAEVSGFSDLIRRVTCRSKSSR